MRRYPPPIDWTVLIAIAVILTLVAIYRIFF